MENEITGKDRDALLLRILKKLDEAKPHADAGAWERGWQAALDRFREFPTAGALVPAFIDPTQPVRMAGAFWHNMNNEELAYCREEQSWLAKQLADCHHIVEFGCGTGFNLVALAYLLEGKSFLGVDRAPQAVQLVAEAAEALDLPILSGRFDMLAPHGTCAERAGVFTFGAMEQLGDFEPFIEWLLEQKPQRVVHIEPIPEMLDEHNLLDWLSLKFHEKRGYTRGLLPHLRSHPRIEILHERRSHFGSLMLESYGEIVWQPK